MIEVVPSRFKSVGEKRLQVSRQKSTRLDLTRLTPNTTEDVILVSLYQTFMKNRPI